MATIYTPEKLRDIFSSPFDMQQWYTMLHDYFNAKILKSEPEKILDQSDTEDGYYLGYIEDNYLKIGIFYYDVKKGSVVNKRTGLRNLVKTFLRPNYLFDEFDAALVVFNSQDHWRLSFVSDIKGESTSPRRYTYVLGENGKLYNTPVARFSELQQKGITFNNIKDAFSVEALTKQFYNDLFGWYLWATSDDAGISFPNNTAIEDDDRENIDIKIIRMITRIMFVWFIKQKGLVPDCLFEPGFLNGILKDFNPQDAKSGNYYNAILQNLFFATLNRAITDENGNSRGFAKTIGRHDIKSLYRYAELFSITEEEVIKLFGEIPFLNGGLFECLDKTKKIDGVEQAYNYDGFSRNDKKFADGRYRNRAVVPNVLFFKPEKGLFPILSRYNFTIEENTPNEQQVALDPELLGKVFENLLGAYNPETQKTARNQSGSFYTPREIVNYMVDESLMAYLGKNETVENLFSDNFTKDTSKNDEYVAIAQKLKAVKVLDPACGSGAFPMGLLNRIVDILHKINPEESIYRLKLSIIENCIYGSDKQSIAIQITKLRFFISLICDCDKDLSKPNFGIPTLPNLETKFVAADSLIGLEKSTGKQASLFEDPEILPTKEELKNIRHRHFEAKSVSAKQRLRNKDMELRSKLAKLLADNKDYALDDAKQMAQWNPYDQNSVSPFFDPDWMFGITDGFDIIIGNPPYISTKGISATDKALYEQEFGFSDDTYNLFTFKGLSLCKVGGVLTYITPKTFWTTQTKKNMRDLLLKNTIDYIYDTANPFEAVMVDTCITQVRKLPFNYKHLIRFIDGTQSLSSPQYFEPVPQSMYVNTLGSVIFKPTRLNLRIHELYGEKVKALYEKWWPKIKTSKDIAKNKTELESYRASLRPGDIALLGCLTEGGQGLATANNGKYIAVRRSTKWATNIIASRPKKLSEAIKKHRMSIPQMNGFADEKSFLESLSEAEIAKLFDDLKEKYGRDIFGQGYIYRIIDDSELANVDELTQDEKENGIDTSKNYYVPYDKGDKDGNRWYLETPFAIAWSKENVRFLNTNSGKKGEGMPVVRNPQFYFREGFCWIDVNSTYLKARVKAKGIFDVLSMSLFTMTQLPDWYFVSIINSEFISLYVDNFINNTSHFQINDARQLPIVIPNNAMLEYLKGIVSKAIYLKKDNTSTSIVNVEAEEKLSFLQKELDNIIVQLYAI